jgi:galactoside O-acetyltransferase
MDNSFYTENELNNLGLNSCGNNVRISRFARFYDIEHISIGNNVRIDDFCILSGKIIIGNNIHISAYVALYGKGGIVIKDFAGISPGSIIFSASDDFSGNFMVGPMISDSLINVTKKEVIIGRFVQIGTLNVVLPGVILEEGVATGAVSLINKCIPKWTIVAGTPCRKIKERNCRLKELYEEKYEKQ